MSETLTHLPVHLAIIMDGNGRWAQARGLPREAGHRAGAETVRTIVTECRRLGIRHLTLYTFSSENWSRPKTEVSALFSLLLEFLGQEVPRMEREGIRLNILGDMEALPLAARTALRHGLRRTAANTDMVLNLALNYGGRAELVRAVRSMMTEGRLNVVTAIMKLRMVPNCAPLVKRASATGMVPKISAYMGTPTRTASTTPKGFREPRMDSTQA